MAKCNNNKTFVFVCLFLFILLYMNFKFKNAEKMNHSSISKNLIIKDHEIKPPVHRSDVFLCLFNVNHSGGICQTKNKKKSGLIKPDFQLFFPLFTKKSIYTQVNWFDKTECKRKNIELSNSPWKSNHKCK